MTRKALIEVLAVIGMMEGLVPLVARGIFDGRALLAPAVHLPAPWWWLISATVLVACAVGVLSLDRAEKAYASR